MSVQLIEGKIAIAVRQGTKPAVSLIVCTLGRHETLRRLFESLASQTFQDFEVIVVDQNKPMFLNDLIEHYRSRFSVIHISTPPGLSAARNTGLSRAGGDVIAFPDDDCWYKPETLADAFAAIGVDKPIVSGRTIDANGATSVSLFLPRPSRISRVNYLKCGNSNCLFFRREVFQQIGSFDPRLGVGAGTGFHSSEEADMLLRALDAGLVGKYFPDLKVHHDQVEDTTTPARLKRAREYGRGFGALLRKHRFSTFVVAYAICRPLFGAVLSLISGDLVRARCQSARSRSIAEGYRRWPIPRYSRQSATRG